MLAGIREKLSVATRWSWEKITATIAWLIEKVSDGWQGYLEWLKRRAERAAKPREPTSTLGRLFGRSRYLGWVMLATLGAAIFGLSFGGLLLQFLNPLGVRRTPMMAQAVGQFLEYIITWTAYISTIIAFVFACMYFARAWLWAKHGLKPVGESDLYGSARFADYGDLKRSTWLALAEGKNRFKNSVLIGNTSSGPLDRIFYSGDRHLLTVAPTRAGKTRGAVIPNALEFTGSVLVIDPKGEVRREVEARNYRGGMVVAFAPFSRRKKRDSYNPLDLLDPTSAAFSADAMMLADAIVYPSGGERDPFWIQEAQALLATVLMFVAIGELEQPAAPAASPASSGESTGDEKPETDNDDASPATPAPPPVMSTIGKRYGKRTLGRVRELVTLGPKDFDNFIHTMFLCPHELVSRGAARHMQKASKEASGVLSSVQSATHFLDVPDIEASLEKTTFSFHLLRRRPAAVFLELPPQYLQPLHRYMRLLVTSALRELVLKPPSTEPEPLPGDDIIAQPWTPVLFILDEFASLGRLAPIEEAYALMAGYGVQLWAICQDLSQLKDLYGERYQTFIANAGVFQVFGSRDLMTAEYASRLAGTSTRENGYKSSLSAAVSYLIQWWYPPRMAARLLHNHVELVQRPLVFADEVLTMSYRHMLLFVEQTVPVLAEKLFVEAGPRPIEPDPEEPPRFNKLGLPIWTILGGTTVAILIAFAMLVMMLKSR